ncbi:MAG: hypothetical protein JWO41_281 [Candidatus Saccharibacteria bacterium]|nr:hypothetical protein [Candidatus Saccharibacteria bacterium]
MSAKRSFYVMCALVILLMTGIVGGTYVGQVLLKKESDKLVGLKAKVDALGRQETALKQAKKDITASTDLYNIAKVVVPENKNQAQAVRQIVKIAGDNQILLDSINFPASTLGNGAAPVKGATAATGSVAGASATSGTNPQLSQLTPVLTIPGVYDLQLTITSSTSTLASYSQLINFLSSLEHNRQTALVSSISIQPDNTFHNKFSFSLVLDIYIKP